MPKPEHRWSVCLRNGRWRVLCRGAWAETYDTLAEAHTAATQNAVADWIYRPGALTELASLLDVRDWLLDPAHRKDCTL